MNSKKVWHFAWGLFGILLSFIVLIPLYYVLINSVKTQPAAAQMNLALPTEFRLVENYIEVIKRGELLNAFKNSIIISIVATGAILLFSAMAAYIFQRRGGWVIRRIWILVMIGLIMPASMVTTTMLCRYLRLPSHLAVILVFIATQFPLSTFIFRGFYGSIPRELDEAAAIDGCGSVLLFFRIIFPLLKPVIMTVFILNFIEIWNNFSFSIYFLTSSKDYVMPLTIYFFFGQYKSSWNLVFADVVLVALPVVIAYILAQKHIISGMVSGAVKG
jgi:raffinose/stachyose/melibiose transport system permease protein